MSDLNQDSKKSAILTKDNLDSSLPLEKNDKIIFKVTILGDGGVGKTTLCKSALENLLEECFEDYKITIGVQFFTQTFETDIGETCLCIWDLAGQDQFADIAETFLLGSKGILLAYDSSDIATYFSIHHRWIPLINDLCEDNIPILLVSMKNDLEDSKEVYSNEVEEFIQAQDEHGLNIIGLVETSSKTNKNVSKVFGDIANSIINQALEKLTKK